MPARSDIDPVDMPRRLLPFISLVDVVADERRYVYRLVGTGDVEVRGQDPTGKSVLEGFFAPNAEDALACYDRVVATRAPFLDPEEDARGVDKSHRAIAKSRELLRQTDDLVRGPEMGVARRRKS